MNEINLTDIHGEQHSFDLDSPASTFLNADCMEVMRQFPDDYFSLAIVDPPYGDPTAEDLGGGGTPNESRWGSKDSRFERYKRPPMEQVRTAVRQIQTDSEDLTRTKGGVERTGGTWAAKYGKKIIAWDIAPEKEYFDELFRISRNQIIWGGNYFELPPTRCFLVWKKLTISESFTMAMAEYAWTSFNSNAKVFECAPQGKKGDRFHPAQKPIELYKWIINNYANPDDMILDTHVGSASSLIACHETGHKYFGMEIDEYYYEQATKRLARYTQQNNIFDFL